VEEASNKVQQTDRVLDGCEKEGRVPPVKPTGSNRIHLLQALSNNERGDRGQEVNNSG
jgi:hypothetical protein